MAKVLLRKWLLEEGLWKKERKSRKHRHWRERKAYYEVTRFCKAGSYFGEMVQMDGSHHDWLEGRGSELVLMAYIDDATCLPCSAQAGKHCICLFL